MRKYLLLLLSAACAIACGDKEAVSPSGGDDGPTAPTDRGQQVVCGIMEPLEGVSVDLDAKLKIVGTGVATVGTIAKAVLTVGGVTVAEVTTTPFEIEYVFPAGQEAGELELVLSVEGDAGATASDKVKVTVFRQERPAAPEPGSMTDPRDGNVYKTVKLADQTWMAENLRYLPQQHDDMSTVEPRYYVWYDHDATTELGAEILRAYGAFYNWPAALQGAAPATTEDHPPIRGVCPEGWHIPSQAEWRKLAKYVLDAGMAAVGSDGAVDETALAKALASQEMWIVPPFIEGDEQPTWVGVGMDRNNATLFNGVPIGFRSCSVGEGGELWDHACYSAGWWSSTQGLMGEGFAAVVRMWSDNQRFVTDGSDFNAGVGLTVRCLQD